MSDPRIAWAVFAPIIAAGLVVLLYGPLPGRWRATRLERWLDLAVLLIACAGLIVEVALLLPAEGTANLPGLGETLAISPLARLGAAFANIALLCVVLVSWSPRQASGRRGVGALPTIVASMITASLLAWALLSTSRLVTALCLFGAALVVTALAALPLPASLREESSEETTTEIAKRLAAGLKHVSLATIGTALLAAGSLLLASYTFNLEKTGTLQIGLGLLAVGLAVRAGIMPFTGGASGLPEANPQAAIIALGAVTPTVLIAGILMLSPLGPNSDAPLIAAHLNPQSSLLLLGSLGALLAGVRALALLQAPGSNAELASRNSQLATFTGVALQAAWALFGVLAGSRAGMIGAALLAANLAVTVPLLAARGSKVGLAVGAASLLGLPPLGGFAGTLLVAQSAIEAGGAWLAMLVLGSVLTAVGWLGSDNRLLGMDDGAQRFAPGAPLRLLSWTLIIAQVAMFVLALPLARGLYP